MGIYTARVVSHFNSMRWEAGVSACVDFYQEWYHWLVPLFRSQNKLPPPTPQLFADLVRFVVENSFIYLPVKQTSDDPHYYNYHQTSGVTVGDCISGYVADCYSWFAMRPVCVDFGLAWRSHTPTTANSYNDDDQDDQEDRGDEINHNILVQQPPQESADIIFLARYVDDLICITRSPATFDLVLSSINSNSTSNSIVFRNKQENSKRKQKG